MIPVRFIEDTGSYAHRTKANARWADLTVAISVDSDTPGERLTRDSAGDKYLGLTIPKGLRIGEDRLIKTAIAHGNRTAEWINDNVINPDGVRINIAGNGMRTLARNGISQETADCFMEIFIKTLCNKLKSCDSPYWSSGRAARPESTKQASRPHTR